MIIQMNYALILDSYRQITSSLTFLFVLVGELIMFLPVSADSWIRPISSSSCPDQAGADPWISYCLSLSLIHPLIGATVKLTRIARALSLPDCRPALTSSPSEHTPCFKA